MADGKERCLGCLNMKVAGNQIGLGLIGLLVTSRALSPVLLGITPIYGG